MSAPLAGVVPIPQTPVSSNIIIIIIIIIIAILLILSLTRVVTTATTATAATTATTATGATGVFDIENSRVFEYDNNDMSIDKPVKAAKKDNSNTMNQDVYYDLSNKHLFLTNGSRVITSHGPVEDSLISTWDYSSHPHQSWDIDMLDNGAYVYSQNDFEFCIAGANGPSGTQLRLKKCNIEDKDQQWAPPKRTTSSAILNKNRTLAFKYVSTTTTKDSPITLSSDFVDGGDISNQIVRYDTVNKHLQLSNGKCISSHGQTTDSMLATWGCKVHPNQSWDINKISDDMYQYKQTGSEFCIAGANGQTGDQLKLKSCNKDDTDQHWTYPIKTNTSLLTDAVADA